MAICGVEKPFSVNPPIICKLESHGPNVMHDWQEEMVKELVNHPQHYGGKDSPFEHVKVMEYMLDPDQFGAAMLYQVTKYLWRHGKKEHQLQDLEKARWYLNRWIINAGGTNWNPDDHPMSHHTHDTSKFGMPVKK